MIPFLIFVVFLWSLYSYIVDGIVVPTLRTHIRNRIYATRDTIRRARIETPHLMSDEAFAIAESFANAAAFLVPHATFGLLVRSHMKRYQDRQIQLDIDRELEIISQCSLPINRHFASIYRRVVQASVANSSTWSVFIFPSYVISNAIKKLQSFSVFYSQVQSLLSITTSMLNRHVISRGARMISV